MKGDFTALLAVLINNQEDVQAIVEKVGVANLIKAAPALVRIMQTISRNRNPVQEIEKIRDVLMYNEETKDKVKAFQEKHKLDVDGIVGNQTWSKVEELLK